MQHFERGKLFGITHDRSGAPTLRVPRNVKVSIGLSRGPAVNVYIDEQKKWCISVGVKDVKVTKVDTKAEAMKQYALAMRNAPERTHPAKLPWFSFVRIDRGGIFVPQFDLIESHGCKPTEIPIVFTTDEPFQAAYEYWSTASLNCHGNGIDAERLIKLAQSDSEKALAKIASEKGERYFPITAGCHEHGCPYAQPQENRGPACKPHASLRFQLLSSLCLGSEAIFDTTSYRSTSWLFSSIEQLRAFANGRLAGVTVNLRMQPFKPGSGKSAAYAVWVDIRGENIVEMREKLVAGVQKFHSIGALPQPQRQLSAPAELPANEEVQMEEDEDFISEAEQARAMTSEFFPDENVDSGDFGSAIASVPEVSEPKTIEPAKPENLDAEPAAEPTATANDPGPLVSKDEAKLIVITARKKASPPLEAETLTKYLSDKHGIAGGVTYVPKSKVDEICKALRGE